MNKELLENLLNTFGAQFGEIAWYDLEYDDPRVSEMVRHQTHEIKEAIKENFSDVEFKDLRVLEVGAYRHHNMHIINHDYGCKTTATDISAASLNMGKIRAEKENINSNATLVACDFHDLPFSNNHFDVVYIASSVHHTWKTEVVLNELLRVTAPGGIIILSNEPVKRELCFYQFRSNRIEKFCSWEKKVHDSNLMFTISSPVIGSRDEEIFGMIENDRIPWSVYENFFQKVQILKRDLVPVMGAFENKIINEKWRVDRIAEEIEIKLENLRESFDRTAQSLKFSLPSKDNVYALVNDQSKLLNQVYEETGEDGKVYSSQLFGASMKAVVRKTINSDRSIELFRRKINLLDDIYVESPYLENIEVGIDKIELPTFNKKNKYDLEKIFNPDQWTMLEESNGDYYSMSMNTEKGSIHLPESSMMGLILLRFYAVSIPEKNYNVVFKIGDLEIGSQEIILSETKIVYLLVPAKKTEILVKAIFNEEKDGKEFTHHIRLAVCKRVPIKFSQ